MDKLVSVIVTVYNKPRWLRECIESVINQTYQNWELILLEDNSPDPEVRKIMESYDDPRIIRYYSNISEEDRYKTARYATLINIGVHELSHGEYITYLTDDDFYYPHRLRVLVDELESNPNASVVYGPQNIVDADGRVADLRGLRGPDPLDVGFNVIDHNSVMHTRKAFYDAGGWYDVPGVWGGADAYFWRRLEEAGYKFYPAGNNDNPNEAKRYHTDSVQWKISNDCFYPTEG